MTFELSQCSCAASSRIGIGSSGSSALRANICGGVSPNSAATPSMRGRIFQKSLPMIDQACWIASECPAGEVIELHDSGLTR